ncbi:hypothetical protein V492_05936 [Pseudogymnoascus sp. VKM F-4246]|nr:hypothetical protein V492_05936 [Pseudogymnoascus sp. VKM F-4246]
MSTNLSNSECEKELTALLEFSKPKSREAAVFVDFFGWFKDGSDVFLAMEYVPLGDLESNVMANSGKLPEVEARDIAQQILSGLEIMHTESFAHRDLKPQNVLVVYGPPRWWVKLADFGLSKRLTDTTAYHTRAGTQSYMAPEIFTSFGPGLEYTNAVDIWATGAIAYRLIAGCVPFTVPALMKYCEDKSLFPYDPLFDCGLKSEGSRFLRQLLAAQPKDRPTASQALSHDWIISGSSTIKPSFTNTPPSQGDSSRLTEPTTTRNNYNTISHAGLKSHQSYSAPSSPPPLLPRPSETNLSPMLSQPTTTAKPQTQPISSIERVLNLNFTPEQKREFGKLFQEADIEGCGVVTGDAGIKFFKSTRIKPLILGEIWNIADSENRGYLTASAFAMALRLIGHYQAGRDPTRELALRHGPLPKFFREGEKWVIAPLDKAKFDALYDLLDRDGSGYIEGEKGKVFFETFDVPEEMLAYIWDLADINSTGNLSREEFAVAMYLIRQQLSKA